MGHVKAVKDALKNDEKSLAVVIHGDAAVAGQGVVYECLQMAYLNHYDISGVIHIVANNQDLGIKLFKGRNRFRKQLRPHL